MKMNNLNDTSDQNSINLKLSTRDTLIDYLKENSNYLADKSISIDAKKLIHKNSNLLYVFNSLSNDREKKDNSSKNVKIEEDNEIIQIISINTYLHSKIMNILGRNLNCSVAELQDQAELEERKNN